MTARLARRIREAARVEGVFIAARWVEDMTIGARFASGKTIARNLRFAARRRKAAHGTPA